MRNTIVETISFGQNGNANEFQLYGWSIGEDGFTWTLGRESALKFDLYDYPHGLVIEATLLPLSGEGRPVSQRLSVSLNGERKREVQLDQPCTLGWIFGPPHHVDKALIFTVFHPDCFGTSKGAPELAFAFFKLRLIRLLDPYPTFQDKRISSFCLSERDKSNDIKQLLAMVSEKAGVNAQDVLKSFEVLSGNCEFGGIQRLCGAEPLGLLRFAGATLFAAIQGLDCSFEGIGQNLSATISQDTTREWIVSDAKYGLQYHTFISSTSIEKDGVLEKERKKVAFLLRKFREDLAEDQKIFVCVDRFANPLEAALPVFLALWRHGKHRLFWVTVATTSEKVGKVVEILPGLTIGYMDRLTRHGLTHDVSLPNWLKILTNAWLIAQNNPH